MRFFDTEFPIGGLANELFELFKAALAAALGG